MISFCHLVLSVGFQGVGANVGSAIILVIAILLKQGRDTVFRYTRYSY